MSAPETYTCTFRKATLAVGVWGWMKVDSAMTAATEKATVVKKPKTFCIRTRVECIVGEQGRGVELRSADCGERGGGF